MYSSTAWSQGLLQTPGYARAVLATRPNTAEDEIDNLVAARLARQDILTREDPPAAAAVGADR